MPFVLKSSEAHVGIWPFLRRTLWKAPPEDNFLEYPCNSPCLSAGRYLPSRIGRESTLPIR